MCVRIYIYIYIYIFVQKKERMESKNEALYMQYTYSLNVRYVSM